MNQIKEDRFNVELLRSYIDAEKMPVSEVSVQTGASLNTVRNWLRGAVPGRKFLVALGELFDCDPNDFLANNLDLLYSYGMSFAYRIMIKEKRGDYEVKISLSALVRLLKELRVFEEKENTDLDVPESALSQILPQLEERAKKEAEAQVLAMADDNFLKTMVAENKDRIKELLDAEDIDETEGSGDEEGL